MKRLLFFFCAVMLYSAQMWGQTWDLTSTMTATLDSKGVLTIATTKSEGEAMPDYYPNNGKLATPWISVCNNVLSVVIEDKVTAIGYGAFQTCNISSASIPNSVTAIGQYAFANCIKLTSISIPNSVTEISHYAFMSSGLTSITIPKSVTNLLGNPFYGCSNLMNVTVEWATPLSVSSDFLNNASYRSSITLHVPTGTKALYQADPVWGTFGMILEEGENIVSVWYISNTMWATLDNKGILTISTEKSEGEEIPSFLSSPWYSSRSNILSLVINDNVTAIGNGNFMDCSYLISITLPNTMKTINRSAFMNCISLTSVAIPNSVTEIGEKAFQNCSNLTSITLSNKMTTIKQMTFYRCSHLTSVTIPNSVTVIDNEAFTECSNLASVTLSNNLKTMYGAFYRCNSLTSIVIPNSVTTMEWTFGECANLTSVTLSNNLITIGDYSFHLCEKLSSIVIPNTVKSIGDFAFDGTGLTSITIPNSVTSIGSNAFSFCNSLAEIKIPNSVTTIETGAFRYCGSLTTITIPDSVISLESNTFGGCHSLTSIQVGINNTAYSSDAGILYNKDKTTLHTYPAAKKGTVIIPNSVTTIGDWAFSSCLGFEAISIPNSVTTIGSAAFGGCGSLTSITIPNSITTIREYAFHACYGLKDVTVEWSSPLIVSSLFVAPNIPSVDIATATLHVPVGTKALYEADPVWGSFGTIKEIMAVMGETQSVGADGKGSVSLSLAVPSDATLTGSFDIQFPAGMTLDEDLTALAAGLSGLSITPKENNTWQIQIGSAGLKSATAVEYRKIMDIAYKVTGTVPDGEYKALITNLDFTLSDETKIQEESLSVTITVKTLTGIPELLTETTACINNGSLYIQSPVPETVQVYSIGGALLYNIPKPAGAMNYPINQLNGAAMIVKGSSGWVKKVIR